MPIIRVENLSKKYVLRHQQRESYSALRDVISDKVKAVGNRLIHPFAGHHSARTDSNLEEFWALKDVSFDINRGERIGIIGRNGAGKSTLLKILSRITEPTTGQVTIKGRVASLLEVGTGFHPELTGRENIFLNGAILGMSRWEIKRKFEEIVAFAEVERFLDTPVKHYSSGMYVRLAFAVAAHLEPEVLIVDEVLAVGDAQFQKKCLGKMESVGKEGRTVLFVSHNMQAIKQLCKRALLISSGEIVEDGVTSNVVVSYLQDIPTAESYSDVNRIIQEFPVDPSFELISVQLTQDEESVFQSIMSGMPLNIEIRYKIKEKVTGLRVYFDLIDNEDNLLFRSYHDENNDGIQVMMPGEYVSRTGIPENVLGPTSYHLAINAGVYGIRRCIPDRALRIPINVEATGTYNSAYLGDTFYGKLALAVPWETHNLV